MAVKKGTRYCVAIKGGRPKGKKIEGIVEKIGLEGEKNNFSFFWPFHFEVRRKEVEKVRVSVRERESVCVSVFERESVCVCRK